MIIAEKLDRILEGQARLFWILTNVPGTHRSANNVLFFVQNEFNFGNIKEEIGSSLVNGYRKSNKLSPIETLMLNK